LCIPVTGLSGTGETGMQLRFPAKGIRTDNTGGPLTSAHRPGSVRGIGGSGNGFPRGYNNQGLGQ
jgi:hypothetical protein